MEAVDKYIPMPARVIDKPFLMPIEDIFSIQGRGTVVTGRIERGIYKVGEEMEIVEDSAILAKRWSPASKCSRSYWTKAALETTSGCCCAALKKTMWSAGRWS